MNFGQAIEALKVGKKVKRGFWGGYWLYAPAEGKEHNVTGFKNGLIVAVLKDGGGYAPAQPYQADLLAEDWEVIE